MKAYSDVSVAIIFMAVGAGIFCVGLAILLAQGIK